MLHEQFNEKLVAGVLFGEVKNLIGLFSSADKKSQNAGLMENWITKAVTVRNNRLDVRLAQREPALLQILEIEDLRQAQVKLSQQN